LKEEREGMIGYRCPNNLFLYCGDPSKMLILPSREVAMEGAKMGGGGICNLDPKTCGAAQTLSGQVKGKGK